jgi:hypothetical protein
MKHKWHKEIKAWADGAEIEWRYFDTECWMPNCNNHPVWESDEYEFRIKPQPKEPQYLYVYDTEEGIKLGAEGNAIPVKNLNGRYKLLGAIKLED